jgi:hypothetical protein
MTMHGHNDSQHCSQHLLSIGWQRSLHAHTILGLYSVTLYFIDIGNSLHGEAALRGFVSVTRWIVCKCIGFIFCSSAGKCVMCYELMQLVASYLLITSSTINLSDLSTTWLCSKAYLSVVKLTSLTPVVVKLHPSKTVSAHNSKMRLYFRCSESFFQITETAIKYSLGPWVLALQNQALLGCSCSWYSAIFRGVPNKLCVRHWRTGWVVRDNIGFSDSAPTVNNYV